MNKKEIFTQLREKLENELLASENAKNDAQKEANSHGGAMESRYDTFKEEAQYLVSAHQSRMDELTADLVSLDNFLNKPGALVNRDTVYLGSIVTIEMPNKAQRCYIFSPVGGGKKLILEGKNVIVITVTSPLGKLLYKKQKGDTIITTIDGKSLTQKIIEVL